MRSARAFLHETVGEIWQSVVEGNPPNTEQRAWLRLAAVDGVMGTEVQVGLATGGQLVVRILRVLEPVAGGAGEAGDYGYVTATWRPAADAPPARGVFAFAEFR